MEPNTECPVSIVRDVTASGLYFPERARELLYGLN